MSRTFLAVAVLAGLLAASPAMAAEPDPPAAQQAEPCHPAPQPTAGKAVVAVVGEGWG